MSHVARISRGATGGWSPFGAFNNLRLVVKLPLVISSLTLLMAGVLTVTALYDSRSMLERQIEARFLGTLDGRREAIEAKLAGVESDLVTQSANPTVQAAMASFSLSWNAVDGDRQQVLQREFIHENPNPEGQRQNLNSSGSGTQYNLVHAKYHPYLRSIMEQHHYHDVFLVDPEGQVIYSAAKERDFASNLATGQWRDSDLSRVWREASALPAGETVFTDIREYGPGGGEPASFAAAAIYGKSGSRMGTLVFELPSDYMDEIVVDNGGLGETGQAYVVGSDGRLRSNTRGDGPGTLDSIPPDPAVDAALRGENRGFQEVTGIHGETVLATALPVSFKDLKWAVVMEQAEEEIMAPLLKLRNMLVLQASGLTVLIALLGLLFARAIARPFGGVGDALTRMSQGDYASAIPYLERGDDAGALARNLDTLRGKLSEAEVARTEQLRKAEEQRLVVEALSTGIDKLAGGDLTAKIRQNFSAEYEGLRKAFNSALDRLNETMGSLLAATRQIDQNSKDVENASNELSQKAIEQAASLEETAAAITELSASVKSTADAAGEADTVMTRAKSDAETSGQEVNRAMTAMDQIATSSQKITQVTSVIEDLAFQTNLLALNAGVEAARAGEAGRGFAVVASEVRALAQRSSDAAKEINGLIQESADNVTNGVDLVEKAGKSFENLIGDFEKVSASVSSIATAAREQSVGLSEINTAVDQLDGVTQKNAAVATEVHGTGKIMVSEAAKLSRIAALFKTDGTATAAPAAAPASATSAAAPPQPQAAAVGSSSVMGVADLSDDVWAEF